MVRLRVYCYFWSVFIIGTYASVEQFLHKDVAPKCCNQGEFLSFAGWNNRHEILNCVRDVNITYYVLTQDYLKEFPPNSSERDCLDRVFNEETGSKETVKVFGSSNHSSVRLDLSFFPKCCPLDYSYDMEMRRCVPLKNESSALIEEHLSKYLSNGSFLIRTGLSDCKTVIANYPLDAFSFTLFDEKLEFYLPYLKKKFSYGSYCIDSEYDSNTFVAKICHTDRSVCRQNIFQDNKLRCIRKCCPDGQLYKGGGKCRVSFENGLNFRNNSKVVNPNEPFATIQGNTCRKYIADSAWDYVLDEMGALHLNLTKGRFTKSPFEESYCYEHVNFGRTHGTTLFMCFGYQDKNRIEYQISRIALILSCIFLLMTILAYILLPEMQNLHGKTLMCHCASLLIAFIILVILQFDPTLGGSACTALGYIVVYTFLLAFMWSNIMCFDIWWTFGSMRIQGIHEKRRECKRFVWYCLYAFSVPAIITGGAFCMQHFGNKVPDAFKPFVPNLGGYNCFFEQKTNTAAFLVWFLLPIALIVLCNFILYIKTVFYCYKVKKEVENLKDSPSRKKERKMIISVDQQRMNMAVKLFLVMGIPWFFESISVCAIPVPAEGAAQIVQIIFDTINSLQGIYIFCIFILKTRILRSVQKKVGLTSLRRTSQSTTSTYFVPSLNIKANA